MGDPGDSLREKNGPGGNAGERLKGCCEERGSPFGLPEKPNPAAWPKVVACALFATAILVCIWMLFFFGGGKFRAQKGPMFPVSAGSHVRAVENPRTTASGKVKQFPLPMTAVPPEKPSLHASHVLPKFSPSKAVRVPKPEADAGGPAVSIGGAAVKESTQKPGEAERIAPNQVPAKFDQRHDKPLGRVLGKKSAGSRKKTGDLLDIPLPD